MIPASLRSVEGHGFEVFSGRFNLNMILWRHPDRTPGLRNDGMSLVFQEGGPLWTEEFYQVSIDPSPRYLVDPINPAGTLLIPQGQHRGAWKLGLHRGRRALVQAGDIEVGRIPKGATLLVPTSDDKGWFGWNLHSGTDSAGCVTTGPEPDGQRIVDAVRNRLLEQERSGHGATLTVTVIEL